MDTLQRDGRYLVSTFGVPLIRPECLASLLIRGHASRAHDIRAPGLPHIQGFVVAPEAVLDIPVKGARQQKGVTAGQDLEGVTMAF